MVLARKLKATSANGGFLSFSAEWQRRNSYLTPLSRLGIRSRGDKGVKSAPFKEHRNNVKRRLALLLRDRRRDVDSGAA